MSNINSIYKKSIVQKTQPFGSQFLLPSDEKTNHKTRLTTNMTHTTTTVHNCVFVIYIFRYIIIFVFVSCVNYVNVCAIFSVSCVLGLVLSPEEGRGLLPKFIVIFRVFL